MTNEDARSFPPVEPREARCLILGSMPGQRSLQAQQYYAHPRNAFWPIMHDLFGIDPARAYEERLAALAEQGLMLWDVLASCRRPGSLDARIDPGSMEVNDFATLYQRHPELKSVFFNGGKAEQIYRSRVLPRLEGRYGHLHYTRLPSTSPAYAGMTLADKRAAWRAVAG